MMSTGSRVCATGIVSPASSARCEVPFSSSRYFNPIADTDSTIACVSAGSGSTLFSSFRWAIAVTCPLLGFNCGVSELTIPTRVPAIRTSLAFCRPEVSGNSTLMS